MASTAAAATAGRIALNPGWTGALGIDETQDLIARAKAGDRQAFASLYRAYVPIVHRYVATRIEASKVEDFVAEVFVKALRNISRFEFRGIEFSAWLVRIARNLILDYVKSAPMTREVLHDVTPEVMGPETESEAFANLDRETLKSALERLRPEYRRVLHLRFIQGLSGEDTAKVMGKTVGSVRVMQYRALQALKREIEENAPHLATN